MIKLIKIPVWNRKVLLVTPPHDILKAVRRFKLGRELINQAKTEPPQPGELAFVYKCDATGRYVLWFQNNKPRIDTILHETTHIVDYIMTYIGASKEKEARAYTSEYLFNEVRKALRIKTSK